MSKTMLIDAMHAEETRVVVLDGSRVEEFDFESHARKQLRGNIYLAKVTRVEPSLQAAFVEYGGNRHGFLAFNEIHPDYYQIPVADREALMAEVAREAASEPDDDESDDEADQDDHDDLPDEERRLRAHLIKRYKIQEVIKRRQILLVQVVKEERGNKGAALTTYMSLAGRYCVLMPNTARGGGISRKITNSTDRKRLKTVATALDVPQGMGLIIRTAGAKRTRQEIKRDYDYLLRVWENIRETTLKSTAPALIYEEEDLVKRAIRDLFDKDFEAVLVEGEDGYRSARDFMRMIMPSHARKIQLYKANAPLFARYGVEDILNRIYSPVVPLKSGGYLVINQTEALVAIDVNSGKSTKERNIEATALKTNLEAAEEAARQMRLRDLAGLIVIDFIDMDESRNNRAVEKKLKDALAEDRARLQMGKISGFGLMEISRQRRRTGFLEGTTIICPHCAGQGRIRSVDSSALSAMRAIDLEAMSNGAGAITIKLPQDVALYVLNEKQVHLARLRLEWGLKVNVEIDPDLGHAESEITRTVHADEVDFVPPVRPEPVIEPDFEPEEDILDEDPEDEILPDSETDTDEEAGEAASARTNGNGNGRGRRRRRRRGERDEAPAVAASPEATEAFDDSDASDDAEDPRGRRRRRGRRGGRRGGFDNRPRETYGWVRARTPSLENPYVWIDPHEEHQKRFDAAPVESATLEEPEAQAPEAPSPAPSVLGEATQSPTSLVPEELQNQPARRRKRPPRKTEAVTETPEEAPLTEEAPVETQDAPVEPVEAEAAPVKRPRARRKKAEPAPEEASPPEALPEPEPVLAEAIPSETVAAEPDPAEILAPPETPKRGWWRR